MKKLFTVSTALSITLALGACQSSEEGQDQTEDQSQNQDEIDADQVIAYDFFDLEVDYPDLENAYAVEYEKEGDGLDIDITDKLTDREYDSDDDSEAFEEILPAFEQLDFDADTPDEEVAQQLVDAFGFKENYESIELEVDFSDGGEKEFTIDNS
ncbi:YusW family protein [Bacillus sp. AK031]